MFSFKNIRRIGEMKLLKEIVHSKERKKYYSRTNSIRTTNTCKCQEHNEDCNKVCLECNIDICPMCERNFHRIHQLISYDEINPDSSEVENLRNKIKVYIDKYNNLKKEINDWSKELQKKIYDFELSLKNNEIINSIDFVSNFSKNKVCLNSILRFRKIYYNIMEENNSKNHNFIVLINQYDNNDNMRFPIYYDFFEIKNLLRNLNYNSENFLKKGELILNYLSKIPSMTNINIFNNYNFNYITNDNLSNSNSVSNYTYNNTKNQYYNPFKIDSLFDKNTGFKRNYNTENNSTNSVDEFRKIINQTKIPKFITNSPFVNSYSNNLNKTYNLDQKKSYSLKDFNKYMNKIGLLSNNNDLHKENGSQDLLNKSSYSIKSTKYVPLRSNSSNLYFIDKVKNNNINGIKSSLNSFKYNTIDNNLEHKKEKTNPSLKQISVVSNRHIFTNKNSQTKIYIHKKFNYNNNQATENKLSKDNNNNGNKNINNDSSNKNKNTKFQKKFIIINKSNRHYNNLQHKITKEDKGKISMNQQNKMIKTQNDEEENAKTYLINQKIVRTKQQHENMLNSNGNQKYTSPGKSEMFKNAIISEAKHIMVNDYDIDNNEISNINTTEKKNLLNQVIYSPSEINNNTNKKSNIDIKNNITFQTYKINNSPLNNNINTTNIVKTHKNSPFFVDSEKEICIGLELGNSECKVGLVNQNTSEIQLVCFKEDKYSIPTLVSFSQNKKEIKIGYEAEEDLIDNPSQTIFNIVKFFGKKYGEVEGKSEIWPFKVYYSNEEENKPYIKIDFGPQKDKIFYFENILSIYLQRIFKYLFKKINLENNSDYNIQEKINGEIEDDNAINAINLKIVLVITVPNYFSYTQRKLIEKIIKNEIFPEINNNSNESLKIYGKYKINLKGLKIENASSIASICLNTNYYYNNTKNENNILIINIDGGSTNLSVTSTSYDKDRKIYKVKAINGMPKGGIDLIDNFIYEILQKFDLQIKKEILDSSLCLVKLRKICQKIKSNLIEKEKDIFNINQILDNYDASIEISRDDYINSSLNLFENIKLLIYEVLNKAKIKENDIKEIIFIGEICRDKIFEKIIEKLFRQNEIYEDLIYSNYIDNQKDFYIVGGAAYHALNTINNNIYFFKDISQFNIGIEKYNGHMEYIIKKGENIPFKNKKIVKINNSSNEIKIYEGDENEAKNNNLIGKVSIDNSEDDILNLNSGYREVKIEYEINEKFEINIRIYNGGNLLSLII